MPQSNNIFSHLAPALQNSAAGFGNALLARAQDKEEKKRQDILDQRYKDVLAQQDKENQRQDAIFKRENDRWNAGVREKEAEEARKIQGLDMSAPKPYVAKDPEEYLTYILQNAKPGSPEWEEAWRRLLELKGAGKATPKVGATDPGGSDYGAAGFSSAMERAKFRNRQDEAAYNKDPKTVNAVDESGKPILNALNEPLQTIVPYEGYPTRDDSATVANQYLSQVPDQGLPHEYGKLLEVGVEKPERLLSPELNSRLYRSAGFTQEDADANRQAALEWEKNRGGEQPQGGELSPGGFSQADFQKAAPWAAARYNSEAQASQRAAGLKDDGIDYFSRLSPGAQMAEIEDYLTELKEGALTPQRLEDRTNTGMMVKE